MVRCARRLRDAPGERAAPEVVWELGTVLPRKPLPDRRPARPRRGDLHPPVAGNISVVVRVQGPARATRRARIAAGADSFRNIDHARVGDERCHEFLPFVERQITIKLRAAEHASERGDERDRNQYHTLIQCRPERLAGHRSLDQERADERIDVEDEARHASSRIDCSISGVRPRRRAFRLTSRITSLRGLRDRVASRRRRLTRTSSFRRTSSGAER